MATAVRLNPADVDDATRKPLVLLVDDDLEVLAALRRELRDEPYDLATAGSAAQALARLRGRPPHVIVADERMPGTNGSELLADVRGRWPWIGRVILTGYPGADVTMRGLEVGVDFVLHKPWEPETLKRTLRRLLLEVERSRLRMEEGSGEAGVDLGGEGS
jgi:two-component system response regulator HupR/HoxA